jgi:hypothetical protein
MTETNGRWGIVLFGELSDRFVYKMKVFPAVRTINRVRQGMIV